MINAGDGNVIQLKLQLEEDKSKTNGHFGKRRVENIRNCDIFVEDQSFFIYADVVLLKFKTPELQLDVKRMKDLIIRFNTTKRCYEATLPCLPDKVLTIIDNATKKLDLWKLKRITDQCRLQIDSSAEMLKFDANFHYGFAGSNSGKIQDSDNELPAIASVTAPHLTSPLQRSIDREIDELKNFSREQYKCSCIELEVSEGHDNPMQFVINFDDTKLTSEEECLLHNLTRQTEDLQMPESYDQTEIDCGLISILLAICYDVRSTSNESTCESAWTRSTLSATLSYFEPFNSIRDVVISFMRRSLIYPLYRNFDYAYLCVQDAINALHRSSLKPNWILKQLLVTHELFQSSDSSRAIFNRYYIAPYIRFVYSEANCTVTHLQTLARNLKNVLLDLHKSHLRLDLVKIETELLQELLTNIRVRSKDNGGGGDDDDNDDSSEDDDGEDADDHDCGTESDEDETEPSSDSESEDNSVIEKSLDALKISN